MRASILKAGFKKLFQGFKPILLLSLIFLFTLSLSGCFLLPEDEEVLASPVQLKEPVAAKINTEKVQRGTVVKKIRFWAYFLSPSQYNLSFTYMGRLENVYVSQGDTVKAGEVLAKLESEDIENQLAQLKINLKKAQLNYDRLKTEAGINGGGSKFELEDARLNVEQVELAIQGINDDLSKISIISPISGMVSYVDPTEIGAYISLRSTFITVCDKKDMMLVAKKDMVKEPLVVGNSVKVEYNGKDYSGKVIRTPDNNVNEKNSNFVNSYCMQVDGLDPSLINLNDIASAEYIVQQADNVLFIDRQNVKKDNNKSFVYVYKDGAIEEREVVTGIESANGVDVEVKEGLTEDDEVIVQ